ncbi:MAG TPA: Nramp family divalent metal transporter [Gemmatimonadota bacterium]|nr:Nramp family divalent metal transporter [Gemmatimonadota bacterium]
MSAGDAHGGQAAASSDGERAPVSVRIRGFLREYLTPSVLLPYLGPAFVVSVGYMDPGNWATDISGGAEFGYRLLWVLLWSNIFAIFLQTLAAKLGIATNHDLAELCREEYPKPVSLLLWVTAELAMMATDLAEFLGAAIGIHLLFHIGLIPAVLITAVDVFLVLALQRAGFRWFEIAITAMVAIVGMGYVVEIVLARPDVGAVATGLIIPDLPQAAVFVAIGMLGATVMPHNVYLHSALSQYRKRSEEEAHKRKLVRFAFIDSAIALNGALFVNAAILIMSAAVFGARGLHVASIEQAHHTLGPLLGSASATVFAVALLAAGLSSSATGTLAGQVVMEGFLEVKVKPWVRRLATRLLTMIPVIIAVALGTDPLYLLVLSQVVLSLQLPFAVVPLIRFTSSERIMGESFANRRLTRWVAWAITIVIILANLFLIYLVFAGRA